MSLKYKFLSKALGISLDVFFVLLIHKRFDILVGLVVAVVYTFWMVLNRGTFLCSVLGGNVHNSPPLWTILEMVAKIFKQKRNTSFLASFLSFMSSDCGLQYCRYIVD